MKSDITLLLAENDKLKEDLPKIIEDNDTLKKDNEELKKVLEAKSENERAIQDEIDMLKTQLGILKQSHDSESQDLAVRLQQLQLENQRLNSGLKISDEQIANLVQECQNWNDKYEQLQKETSQYKDALLAQLEQHFVERLNSERAETERILGQKEDQVRALTDQIADLLAQNRNTQNENRSLKNELEMLAQQHDDIKDEHERVKKSSNTVKYQFLL